MEMPDEAFLRVGVCATRRNAEVGDSVIRRFAGCWGGEDGDVLDRHKVQGPGGRLGVGGVGEGDVGA